MPGFWLSVAVLRLFFVSSFGTLLIQNNHRSHESLETYVRDMRRIFGNGGDPDWTTNCEISLLEKGTEVERHATAGLSEHDDNGMLLNDGTKIGNGSLKPSDCPKSVRTNTFAGAVALKKLQLNLSEETLEEMLELQGKGIDVDALLKEFLQNREENIAEKKEGITKKVAEKEEKRRRENKEPSRYVGTKTKKILTEEFGTKCAVCGCGKEATQIHHTAPFSINGSNSPDLLKPLCRAHHDIVHSVNERYLEKKGMG